MILENFKEFKGQHCETTATGTLLKRIGIELSEPMIFGLGEGLGFMIWKMKMMNFPFIGGRVKTDLLTQNLCRNLNLELEVKETSSLKKAWQNVVSEIDKGKAVGLKLDCYHLEYFTTKIHFAGHYAAMYGYDDEYAYLVDTHQQGGKVKTSLKNLELARNEKGSMSSRNLSYTISTRPTEYDLNSALRKAIYNNAVDYLNPPIKNFTYKGILKTSKEIKKWFETTDDKKGDFQTTAMLMERAGTGGSLFRNLYRDFLKESAELLDSEDLMACHFDFIEISKEWKVISELFYLAGETESIEHINKASELLVHLSTQEKATMEKLQKVIS